MDDPVLRRHFAGEAQPGQPTPPHAVDYYHLTDTQFSTVAMISARGQHPKIVERVRYSAYGRGVYQHPADLNHDGELTQGDVDALVTLVNQGDYALDADFNRDGEITYDDIAAFVPLFTHAVLPPEGHISDPSVAGPGGVPAPDNRVGYAGYAYVPQSARYSVRFRWYDPGTGRWLQRDPLGYVDGASLYQYVMSGPTAYVDPMGLNPEAPQWHHLIPQQFREALRRVDREVRVTYIIDIHAKEYGKIFLPGDHKGNALHSTYNDVWAEFFKKHPHPTKKQVQDQLRKMMCDPRFKHWLNLGKDATVPFRVWNNNDVKFDKVGEAIKLFGKDAYDDAIRRVRLARAGRVGRVGRLAGRVLGVGLFIWGMAEGQSPVYAAVDAVVPIEETKTAMDVGRSALESYQNDRRYRILYEQYKGTLFDDPGEAARQALRDCCPDRHQSGPINGPTTP